MKSTIGIEEHWYANNEKYVLQQLRGFDRSETKVVSYFLKLHFSTTS
jgi:hypothetical protein